MQTEFLEIFAIMGVNGKLAKTMNIMKLKLKTTHILDTKNKKHRNTKCFLTKQYEIITQISCKIS